MKNMKGVEVVGTLNKQAAFSTLAAIFSGKYDKDISAKVIEPDEDVRDTEKASA